MGEPLRFLFARSNQHHSLVESLPFSPNDVTAGSETELQAAVEGDYHCVDLARTIETSRFYANVLRHIDRDQTPRKAQSEIDAFLHENKTRVWENSWVRFPRRCLNFGAQESLRFDLLADKQRPNGERRNDAQQFFCTENGEEFVRMPPSYLLKLALIDATSGTFNADLIKIAKSVATHFVNDNTSPETSSLYVIDGDVGKKLAHETLVRFLLTTLLAEYANHKFELVAHGQRLLIYLSPHPPVRQRGLAEIIPDSFYRELFMNPCLSGWERGEEKHRYMHLCHEVLSRSQLNTLRKLKESGIVANNLVVLPHLSNTSLANNGIHISLGSKMLSSMLANDSTEFTAADEKHLGDLAIKIVEHFLPLFVGVYSGAPYRLGFNDFHPERVLGFLPHQLDYTHLRMIWRLWKKKAHIKRFGYRLTPFGPPLVDETIAKLCRLAGDFVPDSRLLDYLVALLSTSESSALDGNLGNSERLKRDLLDMGVFDPRMSLYLFYKMRAFADMGFSGFEGRQHSLFPSITRDMTHAANLQLLVTSLAIKYVALERVAHRHIPNNPSMESERRQIIFGAAIGLPYVLIRQDTANQFLRRLLYHTKHARPSGRYQGYLRLYLNDYRHALFALLQRDAKDIIELHGFEETMKDLEARLSEPEKNFASAELSSRICEAQNQSSPLSCDATEFNLGAEKYYRETLRKNYLREACDALISNAEQSMSLANILTELQRELDTNTLTQETIVRSINELLESIRPALRHSQVITDYSPDGSNATSIYRAA